MNRTILMITALGLTCQLAAAALPGGARHGRPPIDEIAAKLGLDAEAVLTAEQLASLKQLMSDDRDRRGPPPGPRPSED